MASNCDKKDGKIEERTNQLYKRRWVILAIFLALGFTNNGQWTSFASISNVVQYYYNVSSMAVNSLSMLYLILYVISAFPILWLYDLYGLKVYIITASFLNSFGAWVKFGGSSSSGFVWLVLGQAITAVGSTFLLTIPAGISAVWFGENERPIATSLSVLSFQTGIAVYFSVVPSIVPDSENYEELYRGFSYFNGGNAILCTLVTVAILVAFEDAPPSPPSRSQALLTENSDSPTYMESLKRLITHRSYMLLVVTYGIYTGTFYAYATLLNEMVSRVGRETEVEIGLLGFAFVIAGIPGGFVASVYVAKTQSYQCVAKLLLFITFIATIAFGLVLEFSSSTVALFFVIIFLGYFGTSFLPLGLEYAAELTYPVLEGISSSFLNISAQLFGILFIVVVGIIITEVHTWYDVLIGNFFLSSVMLLAFILLNFVKPELVRQEVDTGCKDAHSCTEYQAIAEDSENED